MCAKHLKTPGKEEKGALARVLGEQENRGHQRIQEMQARGRFSTKLAVKGGNSAVHNAVSGLALLN